MSSCAGEAVQINGVDVSLHDNGPLLGTAVILARCHQDLRRWTFESNQSEPVEPLLEEVRNGVCIIGAYLHRFGMLDAALCGVPREQVKGFGDLRRTVKELDQCFPWLVQGNYGLKALGEVATLAGHQAWATLDAGIEKLARVQTQRALEAEPTRKEGD